MRVRCPEGSQKQLDPLSLWRKLRPKVTVPVNGAAGTKMGLAGARSADWPAHTALVARPTPYSRNVPPKAFHLPMG